uniref:C2 domain-containing protein n=1 Tax=Globisporangium ultimum (strain ATCC 200006 / CBS 805.95 / DAOM BR144) TaxID=431595 RepID=K3WRU2_GLOUD
SEQEKAEWETAIFGAARRTIDVAPAPPSPTRAEFPGPPPIARPESPKRVLLHLTIQEARNLVSADLNGKSDPYCVVSLIGKNGEMIRSEEMKTSYITSTLKPVWNAKFTIGNAVDLHNVDAVHLELWDHDHITRNTSLGFVRVPLSIFRMSPASTSHSEVIDNWFQVEPPHKQSTSPRQAVQAKQDMLKNHGDLHLVMSVAGPNLVNFFQSLHLALAPHSRIVNAGAEHTDNRLELTILAAKNLISADFNNSSDPFCECSLLDDHGKPIRGESYITSIKYKTRNPTWEAEHHVFGMVSCIDQAAKLRIRVIDWDKTSKNDPLGVALIDLDEISASNSAACLSQG